MESANAIRRQTLIKPFLHIVFLVVAFQSFGQTDDTERAWKSEKDKVVFRKAKKYKGPDEWYASSPADMQSYDAEETYIPQNGTPPSSANSPGGTQTYTPQQIQEEREKRYGKDYSGGGNGKPNPELIQPEPIEIPDFDSPDIDAPDVDLPDVDAPDFLSSGNFWKILLVLLLLAALVWILYIVIKNRRPRDRKVVQDVENDWNPEVITKTQLELMLEKATVDEDYRECVRIYFMFILKELTRKAWIKWRAEKTNYDYLLEMRGRDNFDGFDEVVRIYDLVWYGDYAISKEVYERLQPALLNYYKSLDPTDE